ncbi:nitrile hydratase subunit beta [Romeria aff. gracilis LEGE 07310]|uniref:Nitrile hydratase subunit beta n=1 Tax=Vasconcelosia minhoensis LEGE 07310 TaxID=915328 RepID=A0A8J7AL92_9CYAN|nr:SH3-like domain-containing protein [Romeria gracilis]MBE9079873.1 nitrile hydratase subunit beta [Romeria aff. gracilis LEGE 07310]
MAIETPNTRMTATQAEALLRDGLSCQAESDSPALFQVGDRVRAKVMHPQTYTRLPRYVRGKTGTIVKDYGVYVFPDTVGQRLDPKPQHVYSVRFAAQDLWGAAAAANDALYLDLFDDHLEPI